MMKLLRALVCLACATAVLCGGAVLGGAFIPAARADTGGRPSRLTDELAYARDGEIAVGDSLVVNGQPMQLSLFYTSDAPGRVAGFYEEAFRARGVLPIASVEDQVAHVSAFDPQDGMQRFITALPQPDGQTLVMVGVTNPRKPPRLLTGAKGAPFPVPGEHRAFLGYDSEDAGAHAQTGEFVTSLSAAEVLAFYRQKLAAEGYAERKDESSEGMLLFARGDVSLSVAVQALDAKKGAAVFVNRLSGGAR